MVADAVSRRKPRSSIRSINAAHRSVAEDAAALVRSNPILPVIESLRSQMLERVLPRFRPAWREGIDQLEIAARTAGDMRRAGFLSRLASTLDEAAGLENEVGRTVRQIALDTAWSGVRDYFGSKLDAMPDRLRTAVEEAREHLADVEKGLERSDAGALELVNKDAAVELGDLREVAGMNWMDIGPHLDEARSILKVGEALLEADRRSRIEEPAQDRSAARCLFLQRAAAILSLGHGERVCELIDESIKKERSAAARLAEYQRARCQSRIVEKLQDAAQTIARGGAGIPERRQLAAEIAAEILPVLAEGTRTVVAEGLAPLAKRIDATRGATPPDRKLDSKASAAEVYSKPIGKLATQELERVDTVLCQILADRPKVTLAELLEALKAEPRAPWCRAWTPFAFKAALQGRPKRGGSKVHRYGPKFPRAKSKWDSLHGV